MTLTDQSEILLGEASTAYMVLVPRKRFRRVDLRVNPVKDDQH